MAFKLDFDWKVALKTVMRGFRIDNYLGFDGVNAYFENRMMSFYSYAVKSSVHYVFLITDGTLGYEFG